MEPIIDKLASSLIINRILPPFTLLLFIVLIIGIYRVARRNEIIITSKRWAFLLTGTIVLGTVLRVYAGRIFFHTDFQYLRIAHSIFRTGYFSQCINSMKCIPVSLKAYVFYPSLIASIYNFTGVTLKVGTIINLVFGTLVIPLAGLKGYLEDGVYTAVYYAFLTAVFPLAIGYSKIPDSHIAGIFFMFLALVLLKLSERDVELFFLAVISAILGFNSKQYHIFLIIPIVSKFVDITRRRELGIWVKKKIYLIYIFLISSAVFLLLPHNFLIITTRVLPSQGLGVSNLFIGLADLLNRFPVFWIVLSVSFIGLAYSIAKRENLETAIIFTVYTTAALTHAPGEGNVPLRILNPSLLLLFFFGARMIGSASRRVAETEAISPENTVLVVFIAFTALFMTTSIFDSPDENIETKDVKTILENVDRDPPVYTFDANILISASTNEIIDLCYHKKTLENEESESIVYIGDKCMPEKTEDEDIADSLELIREKGYRIKEVEDHGFNKKCIFEK